MSGPFVITKDLRGAQVHVRMFDTGACVGCIEAGLYEIVRTVIADEIATSAREGIPAEATKKAIVSR